MLSSPFPFPAAIRQGLHRRLRVSRRHFGGIAIVFAVFSLALFREGVYNMLVSLSPVEGSLPGGGQPRFVSARFRVFCPPRGQLPPPGKERMFS